MNLEIKFHKLDEILSPLLRMKTAKNNLLIFLFALVSVTVASCHSNCQRYNISSDGNRVLDTREGIIYTSIPNEDVYSALDLKMDTLHFGKAY